MRYAVASPSSYRKRCYYSHGDANRYDYNGEAKKKKTEWKEWKKDGPFNIYIYVCVKIYIKYIKKTSETPAPAVDALSQISRSAALTASTRVCRPTKSACHVTFFTLNNICLRTFGNTFFSPSCTRNNNIYTCTLGRILQRLARDIILLLQHQAEQNVYFILLSYVKYIIFYNII